ncbi:hypothetical protein OEZ86_012956 [Tetradesmus obliquus]|nr:hypothetical protein OEZ86_012956 [Tetradesmus obliquus]
MGGEDDPPHESDDGKPLLLQHVQQADAARSAAVVRAINIHVLPIFLAMATLCYIDRTNTAFASLQMNRDLRFSAETYGLGSGLFFLGYSASMIPSQLVLMRVGAPRWLGFIVTGWGLTAMSFSAMRSKHQFWALRVCLGMFESGAFPGMWHYLNSFYPADAITLPYSLIEAAVGLANVAGAPLAAVLLLLDGTGGWAGWRWLFLIEGVPSVATGIAMLYVLPKDFAAATFLGAADKAWLAQAHAASKRHAAEAEVRGPLRLLYDAAANPRVWLVGLAALLKNAAMVGILFWCPIIRQREKAAHTAVPYFAAALLFIIFPFVASSGGAAAFVCLVLAITLLTAPNAILNSLASAVSQGPSAAVGLALYNAVGNVGGLLGPWLIGRVVEATGGYAAALQALGLMWNFSRGLTGGEKAVAGLSYSLESSGRLGWSSAFVTGDQCKYMGEEAADTVAEAACKFVQANCNQGNKQATAAFFSNQPVSATECASIANGACQRSAMSTSNTPCGVYLYFGFKACSGKQFTDMYKARVVALCRAATSRRR